MNWLLQRRRICEHLGIDDFHFVEIETKKRILPAQVKAFKKFLLGRRRVRHVKSASFFDQFLDTPDMAPFRLGASLRLRYKKNGSSVYLQYKGPGFLEQGLLVRSEFSSRKLRHFLLEESHHDMIRFSNTSVRDILRRHVAPPMARALRRHLGADVLKRLTLSPLICMYQKEKFAVDLGSAFLEPSIDRVFAFHINKVGLHPLSTFWEYENEIKADRQSMHAKLTHLPELMEFEAKLLKRFDLHPEPLDKYHRCLSIFLPKEQARLAHRLRRAGPALIFPSGS